MWKRKKKRVRVLYNVLVWLSHPHRHLHVQNTYIHIHSLLLLLLLSTFTDSLLFFLSLSDFLFFLENKKILGVDVAELMLEAGVDYP